MRKIILSNWISLDGFFAGKNGEIDWIVQDPEVTKTTHEWMHADTMLLGRVTYESFESFWPHVATDPKAPKELLTLAKEVNQMTKVVFSKTMKEVTWENSKLFNNNLIDEVRKLKQGEGADIVIFGSGTIVQQLAGEGLIDEYLIAVSPVVLGAGKQLFENINKMSLTLLEAKSFESGTVLMHYAS